MSPSNQRRGERQCLARTVLQSTKLNSAVLGPRDRWGFALLPLPGVAGWEMLCSSGADVISRQLGEWRFTLSLYN